MSVGAAPVLEVTDLHVRLPTKDPMTSLNPVYRVRRQLVEVFYRPRP